MTIDERIEYLMQSIESHDRQIAELTDNVALMSAEVRNLSDTATRTLTAVNTLAGVVNVLADAANNHERRLLRLEDNE